MKNKKKRLENNTKIKDVKNAREAQLVERSFEVA